MSVTSSAAGGSPSGKSTSGLLMLMALPYGLGSREHPRAPEGGAMTHVVVTGGAGFIGARLARELLAAGTLGAAGAEPRPLSRLTIIDRAPAPPDLAADGRVNSVTGDLTELIAADGDLLAGADVIFHLAAAVSAECEADFDLGMHANLAATQALLAACRALGT